MKNIGTLVCAATAFLVMRTSCGSVRMGYDDPDLISALSNPMSRITMREKVTPERFSDFLENCTVEERIALMQSLRGLRQEIGKDCYGKLDGLFAKDKYVENEKDVTGDKQLLPRTYNDVLPTTVKDAMDKGHLSEELVSPQSIKKEMVWRRYNKINYPFHPKDVLDYHRDYVMWAAKKCDVEADGCDRLSTFYLERAIYEKKFADIWNQLTLEQREKLLAHIEEKTGSGSVGNKVAIVSLSGAGAVTALSTTVAFSGFAFYTSITTGMSVAAGWVGVTLPFAAYTATTAAIKALCGPIGWCIVGAEIVGGGIAAGWPDSDLIISFVMTVNVIKAKKL